VSTPATDPATTEREPTELRLSESDRDIVAPEARAVAAALQDRQRRAAYQQLAAEADEGVIPPALVGDLERLLEMGLQTGRFRGRYGPGGETAMARLFARTPRGAEISQRVAQANAALAALVGQTLEQISFSLAGWNAYAIQLKTDRYALRIRVDGSGVQAESLEIDA